MSQSPMLPDLHDIVLPEPVSLMPETVAWWILLAAILLLLGWVGRRYLRARRAGRYRRLALARLDEIERTLAQSAGRETALVALPELVKQTALAFAPRSEVASLSGEPWLRFLDASYGGTGFTEGPGRWLPTLAYANPAAAQTLATDEQRAVVDLVRRWIRRHRVRA